MASWYVDTTGSDSNAGTSTGAPYLTVGKALLSAASGDTINVKAGTYTVTATLVVTQATITIMGYQTTPGDGGTKPLITTATNSVKLISTSSNGGVQLFENLSLSNTAGTRADGIWQSATHATTQWWVFRNCVFDGFICAINSDNGVGFDVYHIAVIGCTVKNSGSASFAAIAANQGEFHMIGCFVKNAAATVRQIVTFASVSVVCVEDSIIVAGGGVGLQITSGSTLTRVCGCTIAGNTGKGLTFTASGTATFIENNVIYGNGGVGIDGNGTPSLRFGGNNAFGNNTGGNSGWTGSPGDVALTADPFTSSAGDNYSLNSTAGGGALCKAAGYPATFGSSTTNSRDIGAVQSASAAASGGGAYTFAA